MGRTTSLLKKEIRTTFNSPIAYLVMTVLLIGIGYLFFQIFFISGQASMRPFFRFAGGSFLLLAPAITMRLFAEERKSGTIEPLLTLPIREYEVVLGKFLSAWVLLAVYLLITLAYPISIDFIGDLDWGPVGGGYIGLLLMGGAYLAIGIFASSITRNQVVSLIVAFAICLVLFLLDLLLPFVPQSLQSIVEFIGTDSHFKNISRGVVDSRDLVYYFGLIAFMLFLTVQVVEGRMTDHSAARRLNKTIYIAAAAGVLVCANILSTLAFTRVDLTEDRMYTLTDSTKEILAGLDDQLLVKAYFSKDLPAPFNNHARYLRDQLEEYRTWSNGNLRFEFVDPAREAAESKDGGDSIMAEVRAAGIPKVDVQKLEKDQMVMVKVYMGLAIHYHDGTETMPLVRSIENLEYEITSRITRLVRERTPVIGFLQGHGEADPASDLRELASLLSQNYEVKPVDMAADEEALHGVDTIVVAGPTAEVPAWQRFKIDQFIMEGGRAVFLVDRNAVDLASLMGHPQQDGLDELLAAYGVTINGGMVMDDRNQRITISRQQGNMRFASIVAYPPMIRVGDLDRENNLVKNLRDLTLPFVSSLGVIPKEGVEAQVIAQSSAKSWLFDTGDSFIVDPQTLQGPGSGGFDGPHPLAVTLTGTFSSPYAAATIPAKEAGGEPVASDLSAHSPETRLAVVGTSRFIRDEMRNLLPLSMAFFNNIIDWTAQDERLISIRTRSILNRPLEEIGENARRAIKYGNMIGLPLAFILFGTIRWRVRRARKRKGIY